jgi:hypothetical protein
LAVKFHDQSGGTGMDLAPTNDRSDVASCGIAVMAKASIPGKTKTRLVPPLTFEEAAAFNTAFLQDVAANIAAAGQEASIACYMAYGPPGAAAFFSRIFFASIGLTNPGIEFRRLPVPAASTTVRGQPPRGRAQCRQPTAASRAADRDRASWRPVTAPCWATQ